MEFSRRRKKSDTTRHTHTHTHMHMHTHTHARQAEDDALPQHMGIKRINRKITVPKDSATDQ